MGDGVFHTLPHFDPVVVVGDDREPVRPSDRRIEKGERRALGETGVLVSPGEVERPGEFRPDERVLAAPLVIQPVGGDVVHGGRGGTQVPVHETDALLECEVGVGARIVRRPDVPAPEDVASFVQGGDHGVPLHASRPEGHRAAGVGDLGDEFPVGLPQPVR